MCEILHILSNGEVEEEKLYAAAANNWHSWGLIAKDPVRKKLHVLRGVPEGAELPPENEKAGGTHDDLPKIKKFLRDHSALERIVHFRHATKGEVSMENCHPFLVYKDKRREVYMVHNGNISAHGEVSSSIWRNGVQVQDEAKGISDTKEFVDKRIIPTLKWVRGNYLDPIWKEQVLDRMYSAFGGNSRILFIANDLEPLKLGKFETFVDTETKETSFYASDVSYLNKVIRGPVFQKEQREAERRRKEEEARTPKEEKEVTVGRGTKIQITPYSHGMFQPDPKISQGIYRVFKQFGEQLHPNELADLYYLSIPEFTGVISTLLKEDTGEVLVAGFIDHLLKEYHNLNSEFEKIKEKQTKAGLHIESLRKEVDILENARRNLQGELATAMGEIQSLIQAQKGMQSAA